MTFEYLALVPIVVALLSLRGFEASDVTVGRVTLLFELDLYRALRHSPIAGGWVQ